MSLTLCELDQAFEKSVIIIFGGIVYLVRLLSSLDLPLSLSLCNITLVVLNSRPGGRSLSKYQSVQGPECILPSF